MPHPRTFVIRALIALAIAHGAAAQPAPTTVISPSPILQFWDLNGKPLAGGQVCVYAAGTTNPVTLYKDAAGTMQWGNPIILDSSGRAVAYAPGVALKYVLRVKGSPNNCASGNTLYSVDNIQDAGLRLRSDLAGVNGAGNIGMQQPGGAPITAGGAIGSIGIYDIGFSTLKTACDNATTAPLLVTKAWAAVPTQTLNCNLQFLPGGSIQPQASQVVTIHGAVAAFNEKIFDTSLGGAGSIKFTGPTSTIPIQWFGGVGDCATANDVPEAAAIASIATTSPNNVGGYVYHPGGCYLITQDIRGAQGVVLRGDNLNSVVIRAAAAAGFTGTFLYAMGDGSMLMTNAGFENITFDCGTAAACSGVQMNRTQEGTVCHDSAIINFTDIGLTIIGSGAQNFGCKELTFGYRPGSTTAQPVFTSTAVGGVIFERITIVNPVHGGSVVPFCMNTRSSINITIQALHPEGCTNGVEIGPGTAGAVINGVSGDSTVANAIYIDAGANSVAVNNCVAAGSTNCVFDASNHNLAIGGGGSVGHYYVLNGQYISDDNLRGVIQYQWDGTSQSAAFLPASGQTAPIIQVVNPAHTAVTWALDHDGTMISSGWKPQVASPNSAYIVRPADQIIVGYAGGGSFPITLPSASVQSRSVYTVIKSDASANTITVGSAGGSINGAPAYVLAGGAAHSVTVVSDGMNWIIWSLY